MDVSQITKYISDGFDKAKQGDALEIYGNIARSVAFADIPVRSHYALGWIVYYALHQSANHDIEARKRMLAFYLKLSVQKPHKLHSMILTEAIRLYHDSVDSAYNRRPSEVVKFSILRFCQLWNLANLRPGDWKRKDHEGTTLSSTVEKLVTASVDEAEAVGAPPEASLVALVDSAVEAFPDTDTLLAQRAALCALEGDSEKARQLLVKALLIAPSKFFLWSKLAALTDAAVDPHLHIALLYKALSAPGPEQFKGKVRLALAKVLVARKAYPQALWELQRVKTAYEANGWHLSPTFLSLMKQIPEGTVAADPEAAYRRVVRLADEHIYAGLPEIAMSKTYHKDPQPNANARFGKPAVAWRMTDCEGRNIWFNPHRYGIDPSLPNGTRLLVKAYNGKIVQARPATTE